MKAIRPEKSSTSLTTVQHRYKDGVSTSKKGCLKMANERSLGYLAGEPIVSNQQCNVM